MNEDKPKSNVHIHLGGAIILIIVLLVLFKVDVNSYIKSPQFQKNVTYIENTAEDFWDDYLSKPFNSLFGGLFNLAVDKGVKEIKNGISNIDLNDITKGMAPVDKEDSE